MKTILKYKKNKEYVKETTDSLDWQVIKPSVYFDFRAYDWSIENMSFYSDVIPENCSSDFLIVTKAD